MRVAVASFELLLFCEALNVRVKSCELHLLGMLRVAVERRLRVEIPTCELNQKLRVPVFF